MPTDPTTRKREERAAAQSTYPKPTPSSETGEREKDRAAVPPEGHDQAAEDRINAELREAKADWERKSGEQSHDGLRVTLARVKAQAADGPWMHFSSSETLEAVRRGDWDVVDFMPVAEHEANVKARNDLYREVSAELASEREKRERLVDAVLITLAQEDGGPADDIDEHSDAISSRWDRLNERGLIGTHEIGQSGEYAAHRTAAGDRFIQDVLAASLDAGEPEQGSDSGIDTPAQCADVTPAVNPGPVQVDDDRPERAAILIAERFGGWVAPDHVDEDEPHGWESDAIRDREMRWATSLVVELDRMAEPSHPVDREALIERVRVEFIDNARGFPAMNVGQRRRLAEIAVDALAGVAPAGLPAEPSEGLTEAEAKALSHAAGYVLSQTVVEEYRYHRDDLRPAQAKLDRAIEGFPPAVPSSEGPDSSVVDRENVRLGEALTEARAEVERLKHNEQRLAELIDYDPAEVAEGDDIDVVDATADLLEVRRGEIDTLREQVVAARAAVPLSTEVLRDPPDEWLERADDAAESAKGDPSRAFLAALADCADEQRSIGQIVQDEVDSIDAAEAAAQHSPSSLGEAGDDGRPRSVRWPEHSGAAIYAEFDARGGVRIVAGESRMGMTLPVEVSADVARMWWDRWNGTLPPSPAVGLTVEDPLVAFAKWWAEQPYLTRHERLGRRLADEYRKARTDRTGPLPLDTALTRALSAVSGGPESDCPCGAGRMGDCDDCETAAGGPEPAATETVVLNCGCPAPAMVLDSGVCTGCGAQVVKPAATEGEES